MIASLIDAFLTRLTSFWGSIEAKNINAMPLMQTINSSTGRIRIFDTSTEKPCIIFTPDGPNVIEHYSQLTELLSADFRVVCLDMPGFGLSFPAYSYSHRLDEGALAILEVLNYLQIKKATFAFSCANGFYAIRAAQLAPEKVSSLFLAQTPSLHAMHKWVKRNVPSIISIPVIGQITTWLFKNKVIQSWYKFVLPKSVNHKNFLNPSPHGRPKDACFCLAGVVQGLKTESISSLKLQNTPCTMLWGLSDKSHKSTNPNSLLECIAHAKIIEIEDCGHFPDVENPQRYVAFLRQHLMQCHSI